METPEKSDQPSLPLLTPKTASGSQRVIKQIMVIDPNKLRLAGLDIKMAEALKKAKPKSATKSKEDKLSVAKSILNKKLKETIKKKNDKSSLASSQTPQSDVKSVDVPKKTRTKKTTESTSSKAKTKGVLLKSLMPPPISPISLPPTPSKQTVEFRVLKPEMTKQSIEVKILDSSGKIAQKIDKFPKASLQTSKPFKTEVAEQNMETKQNSPLVIDRGVPPGPPVHGKSYLNLIENVKESIARSAKKGPEKEKDISLPVHSKYLPELPNKKTQVKTPDETLPIEEEEISLIDTTLSSVHYESELEVNSSIDLTTSTPVHGESVHKVTESLQPMTTIAPLRRESFPKVIESIVLSPENKIDLSILTKKTPLTIPKKRYKLEHNWITPEQEQEIVYVNVSPVPKVISPTPAAEESAVDFINNISMFFAESQTSASKSNLIPDILAKECSEDATSFLMSLFENKQEESPKIESSAVENIKDEGLQSELNSVREHEDTKEEVTSLIQPSKENYSLPPRHDVSLIVPSNSSTIQLHHKNLSQDCSKETNKSLIEPHFVRALQESLTITSASISQSEITSNQYYKSMTSNLEKAKETIKASSDLNETNIDSTSVSLDVDKQIPMVCVSSSLITETDLMQSSAPPLVTQPVSSRRKGNKQIPILKPKLRKSRKPPAAAIIPPEDIKQVTDVEKTTDKPVEESPTQPVKSKEAVKESVVVKETESSSLSKTDEIQNTKTTSQNSQRRRRESLQETASPAISALCLKKSAGIIEETPTTSKSGRPQRQRKLTLKLIESSESQTINSSLQIKDEIKEKINLETAEENPHNSEKLQDTVPVQLEENASTEAMAELLAFHETVEQFELLCGAGKKQEEQNETSDEIKEENATGLNRPSVSANPFYDAICNDSLSRDSTTNASHVIPAQHIAENIQTEGKENVSGKKSLTKPPRKRKDSLKTRKFDGEDISIVSSESFDKSEQTEMSNKYSTSVRQLRKRKEPTVTGKFEDKEILTPQLSTSLQKDFKYLHNVSGEKSILDVEIEPSLLTQSEPITSRSVSNIAINKDETPSKPFRCPPPTETESSTDSNLKKRKGRPPKTQIQPQKIEVAEKDVEIPQPLNFLDGNRILGRSSETLPSCDEQFNTFGAIDSKNLKKNRRSSCLNNKMKDKVIDDSFDLKRDVKEVLGKSVDIEENTNKVYEVTKDVIQIIQKVIKEKTPTHEKTTTAQKVITDEMNTPIEAQKKNRKPKASKSPYTQTELNVTVSSIDNDEQLSINEKESYSPRVSKSIEKQTMKDNIPEMNTSIVLDEIPDEAQLQEEKPSTSRSSRKKTRLKPHSIEDEDLVEVIEVVRPIQLGTRSKKRSANSIDSVSDIVNEGRTPRNRKDTLKFMEYKRNRTESMNKSKVNSVESASVVPDTSTNKTHFSDPTKEKKTTPFDYINNSEVIFSEHHIAEGQPTSENVFLSSKTLEPSETKQENKQDSSTESSSKNDLLEHHKLPETSIDIETIETDSSEPIEVESNISEEPEMAEISLFDELKSTKHTTKVNEYTQETDLPTQIAPPRIISQFEDLICDLDHIESPSFSPLGDSSRLLDDSDGFEECDEEFTSAIIDTVAAAEKSAEEEITAIIDTVAAAEKSAEEQITVEEPNEMILSSLRSSVLSEKTTENLKSTKYVEAESANPSPSSVLSEKNEEHQYANEVSISTEDPKSEQAKQSSSLYSSIPAPDNSDDREHTGEQESEELKQNRSISSPLKQQGDDKVEELKQSSILARKSLEDSKSVEERRAGETKQGSVTSVSSKKSEEHQCFATEVSKSTEEPKSEKATQGSSLCSSVSANDTSEDPKHTKEQLKQNPSTSSPLKPHEGVKLDEIKQSPSSVLTRKTLEDSKFIEKPKADKTKQSLVYNPFNLTKQPLENPKLTKVIISDEVKQSSALHSNVLPKSELKQKASKKKVSKATEEPNSEQAKQGSSLHTEEPTSEELKQINSMSSPLKLQEEIKFEKIKQSPSSRKSLGDSKSVENQTADEIRQSFVYNPFNLAMKSLENPKHTKDISSGEVKQSSALYSNVLAKSEPKQETSKKKKPKNPFKKLIPKEEEQETDTKSETDFLGFNDEEIIEGQHSTSLRLSQSEDAELINIVADIVKTESPSTSGIKRIGGLKAHSGKKKPPDQEKWEKKSAKSLQSWLVVSEKSGEANNCDIKEEKFHEQNSSIPPKKRRGKVQDTNKSMHLEDSISESITQVDLSAPDKSKHLSDKKQVPKRGRASKLKTLSTFDGSLSEDIKSSREDLNSSKSRSNKQKKILVDNTPIKEETSEIVESLLIVKEELTTPKRGRKPKIKDEYNDVKEKGQTAENSKSKGRKRKLSVSEVNSPAICEPPAKQPHLDANILSTSAFIQVKKRPGRPPKFPKPINDLSNVSPVIRTPTEKKYKGDTEFNPRLLLIRTKEELKNDEPLYDPNLQTEPKHPDDVQCALCMGYAPKKKWIQHVSNHYGIGWIVGQPPPLNIKSRSSVLSFLLDFFKYSKVKGLNCRLCNGLRRSALGLLMHLEQCCLTLEEVSGTRVDCEYCKRNYTKASYVLHKRSCPEYLKLITKETNPQTSILPEAEAQEDVLSNTGRLKRKSVIKAETKLKNLDDNEFVPDDLIKHISSKNLQSTETITAKWNEEIQTLGKGFCASKRCDFTATSVEELTDHYKHTICPFYEQPGYVCLRCKFFNSTIETVRSHVIEKHTPRRKIEKDNDAVIGSSESSDSISSGDDEAESGSGNEEEDESGEKKPKKKKSKTKMMRKRNLDKNPPIQEYKKILPDRRFEIGYSVAKWFAAFIKHNYSLDPLFTYAKTNLTHIESTDSYFPRTARSIKFHHNGFQGFVKNLGQSKIEPDKWQQLDRLNGFSQESEYTIFMGGPVKSIAWLPLEPNPPSNTQYLAVTVRKGLDKFTRFINQKRSRSLIFILKFDIHLPSKINAEIIYAIAIDEGPIHAIEFLPSGGYAPDLNRIGMLAVGTIETEIKIYSLPLKVEKRDCDIFPIVQLEASIELHLERLEDRSDNIDFYCSQCTCIAWSQSAGHNVIVGGFLNGYIGIWDLSDDDDNLNRFLVNEKRIFVPVSYFWTTEDRLMHLALHYDMNGPRWLVASNSARKLLFYDLREISNPVLFRSEVTVNIITSIEWPVVWENLMVGLGNTMPSNGCVISVFSPMSLMFSNRRFDKFCTGVSAIHYNVWKNSVVAGSDNGDIQVTPLREAVLDVSQRLKNDDKNISTLDIVALNGDTITPNGIHISSDGMRVFDANYMEQYGLVFGSVKNISGQAKPEYYATDRVPPLNLYRLTRISQIKFNRNKNVSEVLAIGYDNGLLRVCVHDWLSRKAK